LRYNFEYCDNISLLKIYNDIFKLKHDWLKSIYLEEGKLSLELVELDLEPTLDNINPLFTPKFLLVPKYEFPAKIKEFKLPLSKGNNNI